MWPRVCLMTQTTTTPCDCLFKTRQQHQGEEMKTDAEVCDLVGNTKTNYVKAAYLYITPSAIIITSPSPGAPSPTLTSWSGRHRQVDNPLVVWCLPTTSRCEPLVSDVTWRGTDHCLVSVWTGDYVWWWTLSDALMLLAVNTPCMTMWSIIDVTVGLKLPLWNIIIWLFQNMNT